MTAVSWMVDLDKKEHKNWIMVGCALNITKNGIAQLIQGKMVAWYQFIKSNPPLQALPPCICAHPSSKCATCRMWKKELERLHKSPRPKICWDNSDRQQWGSATGAWEIAKVFMPTLGTRRGDITDANTTDIGGLLNLLEWCPFINPPVNRAVLRSVRDEGRNRWAHSPKQDLNDADVKTIFGHLNGLLNDQVFRADKGAQESSKNLQDLFRHGLLTVRQSEVEALHLLRQSLVADIIKFKDDLSEVQEQVDLKGEEIAEVKEQQVELRTELHEDQDRVTELDAKIRRAEELSGKETYKLKEQARLQGDEIAKIQEQRNYVVEEFSDLKSKIYTIQTAVESFNMSLKERDDLQGALDVISEDLDDVKSCMRNIVMELNTTQSKVANLETNFETNFESIKSEVKEVTCEVETLKAKFQPEQSGDGMDAICAAPLKLREFTGRENALVWLEKNLVRDQNSESPPKTSCCTKTICGLGGCGKTSLAVEFAWRWMNHFTGGVFWVNGESDENVNKSVAENLALLNVAVSTRENADDSLNKFLTLLSYENRPWLLVVDNADDLRSPICPTGVEKICKGPWQRNARAPKNGHILFTTRKNAKDTAAFLRLSPTNCLELQCFSEEEGALFLIRRTGLEGESLYQGAIDLAKELGGLPLALEQAAAYISALPISIAFKDYLDKYRHVKLRLLQQKSVTALSVGAQHRLSVHTTWEMNFSFVIEKSPAAATMMRIASFLTSENIPLDVINPGLPALNQVELRDAARSEIDTAHILEVLTCYSLFSVDQRNRVFGVHKLVQEVVRDSLTPSLKEETLVAAMRVIHCALTKRSENCANVTLNNDTRDLLEMKEEDKNILITLLFNFRQVKDHLKTQIESKGSFVRVLYRDETFSRLCWFVNRLLGVSISFPRLKAEFAEFLLQVRQMCSEGEQNILETMLSASVSKKNCMDSQSLLESKTLADETVQKLRELEKSGAIIDDDTKYRVLQHKASFYALEGQWEKNYKALLELEKLRLSDSYFVELQLLTGRAENFVSSCNYKQVMKRYQNALERARRINPPDKPLLLRVLQYIACHLYNEKKLGEAKPYADEMVEISSSMPHESDWYLRGMTAALRILSHFETQKSEDMLLNILNKKWPQIHKSVINGRLETNATTIEDGSNTHACEVLDHLSDCMSISMKTKKGSRDAFSIKRGKIFLTVAQISLEIWKKCLGEVHPQLVGNYDALKEAYEFLGNSVKAEECCELLKQCLTRTTMQANHGLPPIDTNMYFSRILKDDGNRLFKAEDYFGALKHYSQGLIISPNDAKLLSNRAATNVKLSERQCSVEHRQKYLREALHDSQNAISADPSWEKGYYWKAVCLAHLGERGPSLAAAAVAQSLFPSKCLRIPAVVNRFGSCNVQIVNSAQDLQTATEKTNVQNLAIVMKEGRYQLPEPLAIPENCVVVGLGDVQVMCSKGVPLKIDPTIYMENIVLSPTGESIQRLREKAKLCLDGGHIDAALGLYKEALVSCPNHPNILTSRALAYLKSARQQQSIPSKKRSLLQLALKDADAAIKADPSWLLGYHTKAVALSELDRKPEALAAAAVFKHLSRGRDVSEVIRHYGELQVHVVERSDQLQCVFENAKKLRGKDQIILIKEGKYVLERSMDITQQSVIIGHGKVSIECRTGPPFRFLVACYVENVEMPGDCVSNQELHDCRSNETASEVIRLATPSDKDHISDECKVN